MKKILLPTDFSKNSVNAIRYATKLFANVPCTFYVLNVFRIPHLTNEELLDQNISNLTLVEDEMYDASRQELENLLKEIPQNDKHIFEALSDYNLLSLAVKEVVDTKDVELIVMGTKGATGAKEIFLGSNASDVIMKNTCHVIAVPEYSDFKPPKEIVFPTDFQINYELKDLAPLLSLAEMQGAMLRIVHFTDKDELDEIQHQNKNILDSFLINVDHTYHFLTMDDFEDGINCFIQSRGTIDMIAIIARHYNFFERLFFKPKVKALSFHSKVPLFVIHQLTD
ncbi:universal stress protein [Lutimonas sp.]|uniref:universal stress protein n=1 Tax=Lutimonas sp. TaxID=1872403 RepID=UPI003D9B0A0A